MQFEKKFPNCIFYVQKSKYRLDQEHIHNGAAEDTQHGISAPKMQSGSNGTADQLRQKACGGGEADLL